MGLYISPPACHSPRSNQEGPEGLKTVAMVLDGKRKERKANR